MIFFRVSIALGCRLGVSLAALGLALVMPLQADERSPSRPFPQHTHYAPGTILPGHVSRERLDDATLAFFQSWKAKYLVASRTPGQFYVRVDEEEEGKEPKKISVSEGHGYGMLIVAFMAGAEPRAREFFDGLWRFARAHPSRINPRLMAWMQVAGEGNAPDGGDDSATDGDLDIAHALLLADAQWGSGGAVNYREEARAVIAAIKQDEINRETWTTKLGDWADAGGQNVFQHARVRLHARPFPCVSKSDGRRGLGARGGCRIQNRGRDSDALQPEDGIASRLHHRPEWGAEAARRKIPRGKNRRTFFLQLLPRAFPHGA